MRVSLKIGSQSQFSNLTDQKFSPFSCLNQDSQDFRIFRIKPKILKTPENFLASIDVQKNNFTTMRANTGVLNLPEKGQSFFHPKFCSTDFIGGYSHLT
jgi:hypothetical protein